MSTAKSEYAICAIVLAGLILYFGNQFGEGGHRTNSFSEPPSETGIPDTKQNTFDSYDCTEDCSGHEAGYAWAEKHDITDGDDCDTAGEHSNSPSFAEGCHAYVDGDSDSEESGDSDDEN